MRFFNTAGPVKPADHYCLPPLERFNLEEIELLIAQKRYFILHAPRQVGKTSYLLALMDYLNQQSHYKCLYINVEAAQAVREDVMGALEVIIAELASRADWFLNDSVPQQIWQDMREQSLTKGALAEMLTRWSQASDRPIILLIDEIDSLIGDTLISVLRQLRSGYDKRPAAFPQTVVLCGVRDVRDYRLHSGSTKEVITGGSAFNIKAKSLRMDNFAQPDVVTLYQQHTAATGQLFETGALDKVWALTQGQPWLVNALGYEVCFEIKAHRDRTIPITLEMIDQAKENLILRRDTHLDQLVDKLQEPRVQRVITPILVGDSDPESLPTDDVWYVRDLGLITTDQQLRIANPIYQEVIPRELVYTTQLTITHQTEWYVAEDGTLQIDKLLAAFQQFFREHSESWVERFSYKEAGPQLLLQAFLQRVINSGGHIHREYGLGRQRTDLLVTWPFDQGTQRVVIELKLLHKSLEQTLEAGLRQTWQYMDKCGTTNGHLIIFDRRPDVAWEQKIFQRQETHQGQSITVWGM